MTGVINTHNHNCADERRGFILLAFGWLLVGILETHDTSFGGEMSVQDSDRNLLHVALNRYTDIVHGCPNLDQLLPDGISGAQVVSRNAQVLAEEEKAILRSDYEQLVASSTELIKACSKIDTLRKRLTDLQSHHEFIVNLWIPPNGSRVICGDCCRRC